MSDLPTSELLPLYESSRGFDTAMRGYDRDQVDREINRLDDDLRVTAAERDAAAARSADLAAQLASVHAQLESLRRQLRAATETGHRRQRRRPRQADPAQRGGRRRPACARTRRTEAEQIRTARPTAPPRTRAAAQAEAERLHRRGHRPAGRGRETFRHGSPRPRRTRRRSRPTSPRPRHAPGGAEPAHRPRRRPNGTGSTPSRQRPGRGPTRTSRSRCGCAGRRRRRSTPSCRRRRTRRPSGRSPRRAAPPTQLVADAIHEVRRLHATRPDPRPLEPDDRSATRRRCSRRDAREAGARRRRRTASRLPGDCNRGWADARAERHGSLGQPTGAAAFECGRSTWSDAAARFARRHR